MSKSIEVKKVVLKIGEKEIELSVKEAKELQQILNQTFGVKETVYISSYPKPSPYYSPYPWWFVSHDADTGTIYCSTDVSVIG